MCPTSPTSPSTTDTTPEAGAAPPAFHRADESLGRRLAQNGLRYAHLAARAIASGIPPTQFVRVQWPFLLPAGASAPVVSVEFTNECNLSCVYCDNHLKIMPRGCMSAQTFAKLVACVREMGSLVKVTGNGECTQHPDFARMVRELAEASRHLLVMTNGNWPDPAVADDLLQADIVSVSIDAGSKADYERSRRGGNFDRLLRNMRALNDRRRALRRSTRIAIRLMVRPSQLPIQEALIAQWRPFANAVLPAYVYRMPGVAADDDVFTQPGTASDFYPRCGSPFREQDVNWTGNVPLCGGSVRQVGPPGLVVGNLNEQSLDSLWASPVVQQYREGFRKRDHAMTPICKGCTARY